MELSEFRYNNLSAFCNFCDRTRNPHPEFKDEPIVTTRLVVNQKKLEVCINCYWELAEAADAFKKPLALLVKEKINLMRILNKKSNF
jgi:hypothetical protein